MSDTQKARYIIIYENERTVAMDALPASFAHMCDMGLIYAVFDTEERRGLDPKRKGFKSPDQWETIPKHTNA